MAHLCKYFCGFWLNGSTESSSPKILVLIVTTTPGMFHWWTGGYLQAYRVGEAMDFL